MLTRLSRLLFWSAAVAAAAALFGPPVWATALTAVAGVGLLCAFALWRLHLHRDRHAAPDDGAGFDAGGLDESTLRDIGVRMVQTMAAMPAFEPGLHAAAALLRAELGAREVTVHRVRAVVPPIVELVTLVPEAGLGVEHRVRLERSPLGEALREGRVAGSGLGPFALPVRHGGRWAAVIELGPVALSAPAGALEALFELTRSHLERLAERQMPVDGADAAPARDILTPPEAAPGIESRLPGVGCDRQYPPESAASHRPVGAVPAAAASSSDPSMLSSVSATTPQPPQPAGGTPARAVLDAQALDRLRELDPKGENHLLERVLQAFETSVARLGPQLEASRRSGDRAGIRHVAHTLKSSSASIGAMALSQQCATVEAMIRQDSTDDLDGPLCALSAELDAVLQALRSMLDKKS
ncbi:MAG: Hpt domain-containing protein [Piscinibacter sp.]